ncbi:hypothetical protein B0H13DRAFT_2329622 [Mycena leptocephala]|nr:hypothetical protein B0H13DRAFT_2329622 [Mycena leptocephala]
MRSRHRRHIRIYLSYAHSTLFPALVPWCSGALSPPPPPVPRARTHVPTPTDTICHSSRFAWWKRKRGRLEHSLALYSTKLEGGASFDGGGEARRGAGWGTSDEQRLVSK